MCFCGPKTKDKIKQYKKINREKEVTFRRGNHPPSFLGFIPEVVCISIQAHMYLDIAHFFNTKMKHTVYPVYLAFFM